MFVARHVQITQNNRFAIFFQYLKKEVIDKVDFLHADKHESLLQIDTIILMGMVKHSEVLKIASSQCFYNTSEKKLKMKLIFCMEVNIKVSYRLILTLLASKFHTRWYYHYLRSYKIINKRSFVSATKIGENTAKILNCCFSQ